MQLSSLTTPVAVLAILATIVYSEVITTKHSEPGPVHITYWEKWTDFEGQAMRDVVDYYNKSQSKIHVDLLTISGIQNKTLFAVSAGDPPDVAGLYGPNVAQYADDKAVLPLDDYCAKNGIRAEQYVPAYWNIGFYQNHIYSLPTTPASTALHYNREMFLKAGLDPDKPPKTIEEMDAIAEKMTVRDSAGHITISGFMPAEPGWWKWGWGYIFGGRLWDGKSRITANSPENIRALEWVAGYSRKYGVSQLQAFQSGFGNFSSPQNAFLSSKVAMELQGVWMNNFIQKFAPGMHWTAVPFPYPEDRPDLANSTFVDEDILVIPRGAKHPDEAFQFIKFVQSQVGMEMLCIGQRKHSPLKEVSEGFYKKLPNPYIHLFSDLPRGNNTYFPPQIGIWPEYSDELTNAIDQVSLLKATPKEAMDNVQTRMQAKLDQYLDRLKVRNAQETGVS